MARIDYRRPNDTGFSDNASTVGKRIVNKDGRPNIKKTGIGFFERISIYHILIRLKIWQMIGIFFMVFCVVNLIFATLQFFLGTDGLAGIDQLESAESKFLQCLYFSVQTFTTLGYGYLNPQGNAANILAGVNAFTGLLFFAIVTGLLYGKFSYPEAYIKFSRIGLIAPYKNINAFMMRMVPYKDTDLSEVEAKMTVYLQKTENGETKGSFYNLDLEFSKINSLVLSWTLVHPIDEASPLFGLTEQEFLNSKAEFIISIKAFDDIFSNDVTRRTSYTANEVKWGYKFVPIYNLSADNEKTELFINKLDTVEPHPLNAWDAAVLN
jgi:inward rectifier potassium channel